MEPKKIRLYKGLIMFKSIAIRLVEFYRYFLSPLKPASCRYYPTCSQYAIMQFKYNNFIKATSLIILRILKCNQLFVGGFDYPTTRIQKKQSLIFLSENKIKNIKTIFIPKEKDFYYIVKVIFKKEKHV